MERVLVPEQLNDCWVWQGPCNKRGYGRTSVMGKTQLAHRVAYLLLIGELPLDEEIDHTCRNHPCVNPIHLEIVPHRVNVLRGEGTPAINARKTLCSRGHLLAGENLRINTGTRTFRVCRTCERENHA